MELDLPAGKYLVQSVVPLFDPTGTGMPTGVCAVAVDGAPITDSISFTRFQAAGVGDLLINAATATVDLTGPARVSALCGTVADGVMSAAYGTLSAIQVGTVS